MKWFPEGLSGKVEKMGGEYDGIKQKLLEAIKVESKWSLELELTEGLGGGGGTRKAKI